MSKLVLIISMLSCFSTFAEDNIRKPSSDDNNSVFLATDDSSINLYCPDAGLIKMVKSATAPVGSNIKSIKVYANSGVIYIFMNTVVGMGGKTAAAELNIQPGAGCAVNVAKKQ